MRVVQFPAVKDAQGTWIYPDDMVQFKNTRQVSSDIVGEYYGSLDNIAIPDYAGTWPITAYRTVVTGQELMDLFDKESPDIWMEIEGLTQTTAIEFRDMIGRRLKSPIDLNHTKMITIFSQMVAGEIATQEQVDRIKIGIPE